MREVSLVSRDQHFPEKWSEKKISEGCNTLAFMDQSYDSTDTVSSSASAPASWA